MQRRRIVAALFLLFALVLATLFFLEIKFPMGFEGYFKSEYYNQFGPLAICVELFIAGLYLYTKNDKANFALAVFAFTALLDPFFNLIGLFTTLVPTYATVLFVCFALIALWIAFSNSFNLQRISLIAVLISFILGTAIELFFNYFLSPISTSSFSQKTDISFHFIYS